MVDENSPEGLEVFQITSDGNFSNSHIYMETPVFTPDSKRFVFQRFRNPDETDPRKMLSDYMFCDLEDDMSFRQITDEPRAIAPGVSPDGKYMYYLIDETTPGGGFWEVKRVDLNTLERERLARFDTPLPETDSIPTRIYNLSSISSDGRRICLSAFLGDGHTPNAPWGLIVFDIEQARAEVVLQGQAFCNMHPQYCRSEDPAACHDILVQENHGCDVDALGNIQVLVSGKGADIHVIRDDGTLFRSMPWGRDGVESCQGHQAWRGKQVSAVSSLSIKGSGVHPLAEGWSVQTSPESAHFGKNIPDARRNEITRNTETPNLCHFGIDPTGTRFACDTYGYRNHDKPCEIFTGSLSDQTDAVLETTHLLYPKASFGRAQYTHPHPFLSPDGTKVFFNSDEPGRPHVWMAGSPLRAS